MTKKSSAVNITEKQHQILLGLLIGDAHLELAENGKFHHQEVLEVVLRIKMKEHNCLKGNGGVQRFPQAGRKSAVECKGIRELDCKTYKSSRGESRP